MKATRIVMCGLAVGLLAAGPDALAQTPLGTAFTYQGYLTDQQSAADDEYDFEFNLYDAASGGNVVSGPVYKDDQTVADGLFTVQLDFGEDAFDGDALWLDVGVRPGDSVGNYTYLTPRQQLTASPFALGLRLPFFGQVASNNKPAFKIKQQGTKEAGIFEINNPANNMTALMAYTDSAGTGLALQAWNTGLGGAAFFDIPNLGNNNNSDVLQATHFDLGRAGLFEVVNPNNNSPALEATTAGLGPAAQFTINNINNNSPVVSVTTNGGGPGLSITSGPGGLALDADGVIQSTVPPGTAPLDVASTTVNPNLNADMLDDQHLADLDTRYVGQGEAGSVSTGMLQDGAVTAAKLGSIAGYLLDVDYDGTLVTLINGYSQRTTLNCRADQNDGTAINAYADGSGTALRGGTWYGVGVKGFCNNSTSSAGDGVYGYCAGGIGVHGQTESTILGNAAVFGEAVGTSGTTYGVHGTAASSSGLGVFGEAPYIGVYGKATAASGSHYGVWGETSHSQGVGVWGMHWSTSGTNPGVKGETSSSANGASGVFGEAPAASGSTYGVYGLSSSTSGRGVYGLAWAPAGTNYGVYGKTNSGNGYGVYSVGDFAATGVKSFQIDHPLDPANQYLNHYCAEGPEPLLIYRGNVVLDAEGEAWVELPEYFETINRDFHYQLTCIGAFAPVYVAQEIEDNYFRIAGGEPGLKVSWTVTGVRYDPFVQTYGAPVEQDKPQDRRGTYLHPELYGMPDELGEHYVPLSEPASEPIGGAQ